MTISVYSKWAACRLNAYLLGGVWVIAIACISLGWINNAQWFIQHLAYRDQKRFKYHCQQITKNLCILDCFLIKITLWGGLDIE